MSESVVDAVVVGSGPGAVHAATPLVERGRSVLMLDVGYDDQRYRHLVPERPFREIREGDPEQHRYFLGEDFEGIPFGAVRVGAQLTPPRGHITAGTASLTPVDSDTFSASESFAIGGLGAGWGAGVFPFQNDELAQWPIARADLEPHYRAVAERIGVSGDRDDLVRFFGDAHALMPPLEIDSSAEAVLARYAPRRRRLNAEGFYLGRPRLAVCTRSHEGRPAHAYRDMDFWTDADRSVYRPRWTVEALARRAHFTYSDHRFVLSFAEGSPGEGVTVSARRLEDGRLETYRARALVLAAGALGTARIVLRSLGRYDTRVPFLCNPYTYAPVLNAAMLGRRARDRRHSLAQLSAIYEPPVGARATNGRAARVQAQLFSYRSLLTFRLMKEAPLPYRESLRVMRSLMSAFGILGIHHEDRPTPAKFCVLRRSTGPEPDHLAIHYELSDEEELAHRAAERRMLAFFRRLGCWPIKLIRPGHGASIHYAGTLPMAAAGGELTCDRDCRLVGTHAVYLADGSVFPSLPAKGLTFTIMANANRVGAHVANILA